MIKMNLIQGVLIFFICISFFTTGGTTSTPSYDNARAGMNVIHPTLKKATIEPLKLVENSIKWANSFNGYSCLFTKQERLEDGLSCPMTADVKGQQFPSAVRMEWTGGKVKVSIWREGWDYMALNPRYWFPINIKLDDKMVKKESLNPMNRFGFVKSLNRIKDIFDSETVANAKEIFNGNNHVGYLLVIDHKYTEDNVEFIAKTTVKFGKNFQLEGTEQSDQKGMKFKYDWQNINTNIKCTDKDFRL